MTAGWWRREFTIRVTPHRCVRAAFGILIGMLLLSTMLYAFRGPVLTAVGRRLVNEDPLQPSDAIVVLAGRTPEREIYAAELYGAGLAPIVVVTEGADDAGPALLHARGVAFEPEIERRRRVLRALGVADAALMTLAPPVDSTEAEAEVVKRWIVNSGVRSVIIVTSPYHTSRVKLVYRRVLAGHPVQLRVHGSPIEAYRPETWWRSRSTLKDGLIEWQKQVFYRLWY